MKLTPQASRLLSGLMREHPDVRKALSVEDLPAEMIPVAHEALQQHVRELQTRLDHEKLSDDEESDLLNELGYVMAVDKDLVHENKTGWVRRLV